MRDKVGILTWHYYSNFGSALQAYALQEVIKKLGYNVKIINYRNVKFGKNNSVKTILKYFAHKLFSKSSYLYARFCYPFLCFQKDFMNETRLQQDEIKLQRSCYGFRTIVCGSDQIWAPNVFNPVYMLNFVPIDVNKVSYAASIGLNTIPDNLVDRYRSLLFDFKAVSVRENIGAQLLKQHCEISSKVVLDPTLLVEVEEWKRIEKKPKIIKEEKYVFCYFLNKEHKYKESIKRYVKNNNLKIFGCSANPNDDVWMNQVFKNIGPCEFLWLIDNAEAVITDSYHGTNFSLLYHKSFLTLERFFNNDIVCQNSRIYQLKSYFGLDKQIVKCEESTILDIETINYDEFEHQLLRLRTDSIRFLKCALEE